MHGVVQEEVAATVRSGGVDPHLGQLILPHLSYLRRWGKGWERWTFLRESAQVVGQGGGTGVDPGRSCDGVKE